MFIAVEYLKKTLPLHFTTEVTDVSQTMYSREWDPFSDQTHKRRICHRQHKRSSRTSSPSDLTTHEQRPSKPVPWKDDTDLW